MKGNAFAKVVKELQVKLPFLYKILRTLLNRMDFQSELSSSEIVTMATIYGMVIQSRNKQSSAIQRVYTAIAIRSHADNVVRPK